jgi:hypothetical protein
MIVSAVVYLCVDIAAGELSSAQCPSAAPESTSIDLRSLRVALGGSPNDAADASAAANTAAPTSFETAAAPSRKCANAGEHHHHHHHHQHRSTSSPDPTAAANASANGSVSAGASGSDSGTCHARQLWHKTIAIIESVGLSTQRILSIFGLSTSQIVSFSLEL